MSEETKSKVNETDEQLSVLAEDNNNLILQNHAYKMVLEKHGVKMDEVFSQEKMKDLKISNEGAVEGTFDYEAPKPKTAVRSVKVPTTESTGLTQEDLKSMSHEEINSRWDEVKQLLKK